MGLPQGLIQTKFPHPITFQNGTSRFESDGHSVRSEHHGRLHANQSEPSVRSDQHGRLSANQSESSVRPKHHGRPHANGSEQSVRSTHHGRLHANQSEPSVSIYSPRHGGSREPTMPPVLIRRSLVGYGIRATELLNLLV